MKIEPEKILTQFYKIKPNNKIFLISGNEITLINEVKEFITNYFKNQNYSNITTFSHKQMEPENFYNQNLFENKKKIFIYYEQKNIDLDFLKKIDIKNTIIIIIDTKIKNSSKIKKILDSHNDYITINCYKLDKNKKEFLLKDFLQKNSIKLSSESYWYLIDNTDSNFALFNNEIKKLYNFKDEFLNVGNLRKLISNPNTSEIDGLFFSILKDSPGIFNDIKKNIHSSSDSLILISKIKFFLYIMLEIRGGKEIDNAFPRYLFKQKNQFLIIFKKTSSIKLLGAISLIKKTEQLLKKHPSIFFLIAQRFLINLKKTLI